MSKFKKILAHAAILALAVSFASPHGSVARAASTVTYDFNTVGDLGNKFDAYTSGNYNQSTSGGIGNTGAINAPGSLSAVFGSKAGYSLAGTDSTYRFSSFIKSEGGGGYSGMGFTADPSLRGGTYYRPNDAIGISVHGGGFVFHNGSRNYSGSWPSGGADIETVTPYSGGGDLIGNTDNSSDKWYKVVFEVSFDSSTVFDIRVEVWPANGSTGALRNANPSAVYKVNNLTNSAITDVSLIKSYINFSGYRVTYFDNFAIDLTGNAAVVAAGAPVVLTGTSQLSGSQITFNGNVTSENGSPVTERGFVYSTSSNPTTSNNLGKLTAPGSGTGSITRTTPNLDPGTYYVRAYAINSAGTEYGSEQQTSIVIAPTISWSPTNTSAFALTGTITPSVPPTTDSTGAITYAVQSQGTTSCSVNSASGVVTFTAAGNCVVRATVAAASPYSSGYLDKTFTVLANTVAGAPTSATATAGNGSATVSWTAPSSNGGSAISSYTVTASPGGATCTSTAPTTTCSVSSLTNGTAYTFSVTATNSTGNSLASASTSSVTPAALTPTLTWAPSNTSAYEVAGSITPSELAASNSTGAITYAVQSAGATGCTVNSSTGVVAFSASGSCVIRASVAIAAPYGAAYLDKTFTVLANTVSGAPTNVVASGGDTVANVSWSAPSSTGGSSLTSYTVTASPGGATCTATAPATTCSISGLTNGTAYTFAVTATNATGISQASTSSSSITPAAPVVSSPAPSGGSPAPSVPVTPPPAPAPNTKVSSVEVSPGKTPGSSLIKLKLSNSKPGAVDSEVQIKLFDTNGKLLKVLRVPVTDETGSLQLELALPIGEFTVQASTVNAAGGSSQAVSQAAPVLQQSFFKPAVGNKPPVLAGTKVASPIGFSGNSSVLSAAAKNALNKIAVKLKTAKGKIALTGFSAQVGSTSAFDKALSTKRAQEVANYLKSQGITIPIYFSGYGAVSNSQAAGVPRKVELRLIK